tara:strand:- start:575 stop:907 length:333 start_codon:yes stop_codon:yes gene_type:complete
MEVIKGQINGVSKESGVGKNGKPYTRWVFVINEKKYSTFDKLIGEEFKMGEKVKMSGNVNGQFFNMVSMERLKEGEPLEVKPENVQPDSSESQNQEILGKLDEILRILQK